MLNYGDVLVGTDFWWEKQREESLKTQRRKRKMDGR